MTIAQDPFKSEKQRKYLYASEPEVAKKFAEYDGEKMSEREYDANGWYEVKGNPLSKVGVFPYLGSSIDPAGKFGLDPNKAYGVYRPAEELSREETIKSFKLLPWVNEHTMLGHNDEQLTPAEQKSVEGVIGEEVYFEHPFLKGNIKLFSENLTKEVDLGKSELSLGYRCEYVPEEGVYGDQEYQFVQRNILGNHVASVQQGRMGPEVAVLDQKLTFTLDSAELKAMKKTFNPEELQTSVATLITMVGDMEEKMEDMKEGKDMSVEEITKQLGEVMPQVQGLMKAVEEIKSMAAIAPEVENEELDEEKPEMGNEYAKDMEAMKETVDSLQTQLAAATDELDTFKKDGQKAIIQSINKRDKLAETLSLHVGAFDHSEMTLQEVAVYGCDKLELQNVEAGHEETALNFYLQNREAPTAIGQDGFALDAKQAESGAKLMNDYFSGKQSA